jgi:hypothetical protein
MAFSSNTTHVSEDQHIDPLRCVWVGPVEVCDQLRGIEATFQNQQIFFVAIAPPPNQVLQLPIPVLCPVWTSSYQQTHLQL